MGVEKKKERALNARIGFKLLNSWESHYKVVYKKKSSGRDKA